MHLQRIDFSNNRLSCLPERLFQGLANVRSISLSGNQLSDVPEGIFDGLINLRTLDLSDNQLVKIPEGLLHGLEYLNSVSFSNNKLTALEPRMLCGCENLEYLCVSGNYGLATPQIYTWRGLKSLKRIESNWPDDYVEEALRESQKRSNWRVLLLVQFCQRKSMDAHLLDHTAFLCTTTSFCD
eukprot:TRINITY_DN799_c0_g1_i12.p1 TRINITY_DN799_c0_g1~~TRINITY_DN799_c0_g1_i12.p1  ORF type:complete len:183 (+),score=22.72 TRINITY_DN799_c0_g1_i12:367-915(+)